MRIPKYFYNLSEAEQAEWIAVKKEKQKVITNRFEAKNPKYHTKYRAENREKGKASNAKYNAKNREKRNSYHTKYYAEKRSQKSAIKFFQMTQAVSEIANINTEKK